MLPKSGMLKNYLSESSGMADVASLAVAPEEVTALRSIATYHLDAEGGNVDEPVKLSCADLAARLDVSTQTASRRLQRLEEIGLIVREPERDGQWVTVTDDGIRIMRSEYETYRRLFEDTPVVELIGNVTGGMGEGRHYITLDGYMEQFITKLGYEPYPGTLNLELTEQSIRRRPGLEATHSVFIEGWADEQRTYGPATCYPAIVEGSRGQSVEQAHVIEPVRTHHDDSQLEIIAPVRLRDELDLTDGDRLTVIAGDLL